MAATPRGPGPDPQGPAPGSPGRHGARGTTRTPAATAGCLTRSRPPAASRPAASVRRQWPTRQRPALWWPDLWWPTRQRPARRSRIRGLRRAARPPPSTARRWVRRGQPDRPVPAPPPGQLPAAPLRRPPSAGAAPWRRATAPARPAPAGLAVRPVGDHRPLRRWPLRGRPVRARPVRSHRRHPVRRRRPDRPAHPATGAAPHRRLRRRPLRRPGPARHRGARGDPLRRRARPGAAPPAAVEDAARRGGRGRAARCLRARRRTS